MSDNLRELRRQRELTQEEAAERAGVTYRHYQEIEASARPGLQVATVERLAKAFGVETWELLNPRRPSQHR
ncbi:MAG: helix-turn-helix transcriptional regulator [Opitutaceae bacterium]|nr:helix-turn-helix transcriptional regulator [Opitutaceae bacterium]